MNGKLEAYYIDARDLYVKKGMSLTEISKALNISTKTLGKWKQKETIDWDTARKNYLTIGLGGISNIEELIYGRMKELTEKNGMITKDDLDIIRQLRSLLREMRGEIDIKKAVSIAMDKFTDFIKTKYPHKKEEWFTVIAEFFVWIGK